MSHWMDNAEVDRMATAYNSIKSKYDAMRAQSNEMVREVLSIAEVAGGALGFGFLNQRYGNDASGTEYQLFGAPVDLLAGIGLHLMAWFDLGGKYNEDLHMLGNAGLAAYGYRLGETLGKQSKAGSGAPIAASKMGTAGLFGAGRAVSPHAFNAGVPMGVR